MRLQLNTSVSNASEAAPSSPAGGSASRGSTRAGDISGSGDSTSVSSASAALNALSGERSNRIQQLSAAVQSGQYQVSSAALGSAIVSHAASR